MRDIDSDSVAQVWLKAGLPRWEVECLVNANGDSWHWYWFAYHGEMPLHGSLKQGAD